MQIAPDSTDRRKLPSARTEMAFFPNYSMSRELANRLLEKSNPRHITYMPAVEFFERLYLEQKISFLDGHYLIPGSNKAHLNSGEYVEPSISTF